jgi:hypothetical protein
MYEPRAARLMERAAAHQVRALALLRAARSFGGAPQSEAQRRAKLHLARAHVSAARHLLLRAQALEPSTKLLGTLDYHLTQLDIVGVSVERRLRQMEAGPPAQPAMWAPA